MSEAPHLERLNPEQHRAVTTIEGPLLILAGAGSGKTRVLTRRIAHMIHEKVDPQQILAVTFTNKAAAEMKERVAELIGEAAKKVWVSTFHSTCCRILRIEAEALGYTRRFAIYDDDDQLRMIKEVILRSELGERADPREIRGRIDHYKNRMQGVDDVIRERRAHLNDPLIEVWRGYDEALLASDALDFNDLIGKTVQLFQEHPDILQKWRERFQFVMVDEYQDTNRGQYLLLHLLAGEHRNLGVVGDDDQSIYGFRGADVSNILNFEKDFPEATVVRLEQNYRSTGHILSLANAVVEKNLGRLDKKLWTQAANGAKVQLIVCERVTDEARRVADATLKLRRMGHPWSDISIVYRTNAIARHFETALRQARIPYRVVGGRKFYERREIRDVLAYLRLVVSPGDDAAFLRVVNVPTRGIGPKTLAKLREDAVRRGQPLLHTARGRGEGRTAADKAIHAFVRVVDGLNDLAREVSLGELVSEVLERSGYRAMLEGDVDKNDNLTHDARGRLDNLDQLLQEAQSFPVPPDALGPMDVLTQWLDKISLTADADEIGEDGEVTLMTVHSSKGLEFPVVFVVQMNEEVFPHARSKETAVEEERRLAYVAFTRAMKRLVVTRSRTLAGRPGDRGKPAVASRFLFGIPLEVCDGDLPDGEPASSAKERRVMPEAQKGRLQTFLEHQLGRRHAAVHLEEEHTLLDIESLEQLRRGIRVHHPHMGVGEVRHVTGGRIQVRFANGRQHWLSAGLPDLRIVAE